MASISFVALAEVVRAGEAGALEIRTPNDSDPALVTAIQLHGDIVCSIYTRPLAKLVAAGQTLDGLATCHRYAMAGRLAAISEKAGLLSHSIALLISLGVWSAGGVAFAIAFDSRTFVWSAVVVPLMHWGLRWSPRFVLRLATPVIRRRIAREMNMTRSG
jgi:hypothetical protein